MPITAAKVTGPAATDAARVREAAVVSTGSTVRLVAHEIGLTSIRIIRITVSVPRVASGKRTATINAPCHRLVKLTAHTAGATVIERAELRLATISVSTITVDETLRASRECTGVVLTGSESVIEATGARIPASSTVGVTSEGRLTAILTATIAIGKTFKATTNLTTTTPTHGLSIRQFANIIARSAVQLVVGQISLTVSGR